MPARHACVFRRDRAEQSSAGRTPWSHPEPKFGIGQRAHLVGTPGGNLLWDPTGYVDDAAAAQVRALGGAVAIVASHPHMFGAQVAWSRALGGVPVLVAEADQAWVARPDPVIRYWSGRSNCCRASH